MFYLYNVIIVYIGDNMLLFEAIENLGHPDLAWDFNNKTKEQAEELFRVHCIPNAHVILDNWDSFEHIPPPTLNDVFAISGMSHLLDEFKQTVKTRQQAIDFIKKHNLKPHQADNIKLHWNKVNS